MLSPDEIEEAAERIAQIYRGLETELVVHLAEVMVENGVVAGDITSAMILAQLESPKLKAIIEAKQPKVSEELRDTVETTLKTSYLDDMRRAGVTPEAGAWRQQTERTLEGLAHIISRDNLLMEQGARDAFIQASAESITLTNTGVITIDRALHRAVRKLAQDGVRMVTYRNTKTGTQTVTTHVDVAVRRHIRTQIAQDSARVTEDVLDKYDVELVEVSSHPNSRPTHAEWQGRCYGFKHEVTIEGTHYPDFVSSTGYGSVDGLLGANCRHSFGPYLHGTPHMYEPNPKHPSGLDGEEVYELEQKQRYYERQIRDAKRELAAAQTVYDENRGNIEHPMGEEAAVLLNAKEKLSRRQAALREFIGSTNQKSKTKANVLTRRPDREWAGDMPGQTPLNILRAVVKANETGKRIAVQTPYDLRAGSNTQTLIDNLKESIHSEQRFNERNINLKDVTAALSNPIHIKQPTIDEFGRYAQKVIGEDTTVAVNIEFAIIITSYKTSRSTRRKYGSQS